MSLLGDCWYVGGKMVNSCSEALEIGYRPLSIGEGLYLAGILIGSLVMFSIAAFLGLILSLLVIGWSVVFYIIFKIIISIRRLI